MRPHPALVLAPLVLAAAPAGAQTLVLPDDPGFAYSGYVNATIDSTRASFDRQPVSASGVLHSPGVRIDFTSDATTIDLKVDYLSTFGTTGAGKFRIEVDGVLEGHGIGSDTAIGVNTYPLYGQAQPLSHSFSLVFPYACNVDFLGLEIEGGSGALLGPPAPPPTTTYVAYGDSITHGFAASTVTDGYPYLVAEAKGWTGINMGFFGQSVDPADGAVVGSLGGDWITIAIGTNDWTYDTPAATFLADYEAFLDNLRALQPSAPVFALTPVWTDHEGQLNPSGLTTEDYRQLIRDVVLPRTATDPELYLVEGKGLVPPGPAYFPDGVHPNDAGFGFYAAALTDDNLVADPGFETGGFAWWDLGRSAVVSTGTHSGTGALQVGPGPGGMEQPVGLVLRGGSYVLRAWSRIGAPGEAASFGVSFHDALDTETDRVEIPVTWTSYTQAAALVNAPAQFAQAKVWCTKGAGASVLLLDDVELIEAPASAEVTRLGTPPNPNVFLPGVTSGPVVGGTWDPVVDHTTFLPGALTDLVGITPAPANLALPPFGTLLCSLTVAPYLFTGAPGTPLSIPVPNDPVLAGVPACSQAISADATTVLLTNALDITIGVF